MNNKAQASSKLTLGKTIRAKTVFILKILNNKTLKMQTVILLITQPFGFTMYQYKKADGMATSADPDQTAPVGDTSVPIFGFLWQYFCKQHTKEIISQRD